MSTLNKKTDHREISIDISKAYGMILVFYGHLWFADSFPSTQVMLQNKLIYSFHMPLFFFLSGMVFSNREQRFREFIKKKLLSRIAPAIFYSWLLLVAKITIDIIYNNEILWNNYVKSSLSFLNGHPYSTVTWYLVCLFTAEMVYYSFNKITQDNKKLFMISGACFLIGTHITNYNNILDFWYFREALVAVLFFNVGHIIRHGNVMQYVKGKNVYFRASLAVLFAIMLLVTFNLNDEPNEQFIVLMVSSKHGDPFLFLFSAFMGIFATILLSTITPKNSFLIHTGRNTLVLLGLNGIFRDILNPYIVKRIPLQLTDSYYVSIATCLIISCLSILICRIFLIKNIGRVYSGLWEKPVLNIIKRI